MITRETIDKVFDAARVEEVIGDFVQLKRAGSNFKGLSPFSEERTPSFMVSPVKQIWKDFSTGKGGSAVTFLMEHEHFTYPEAIRYLAKKYNIEIEETEVSQDEKIEANERESMYLVSEFAKNYFQETLLKSEEGKAIGLTYFKERGFTTETIAKFGLGYSPETWDAITKEALSKGYQLDYLDKVGLTIVREDGKHFDRFKGRVMFPIQSLSGRNLGFGGRILTNDKKAAKYLNSPESDIYHKSKVLYGIFHAKQAIAKQNNCYLVEGYTDVIQMHQAGIENVVASSGTALTPDQIRLINRLTKNITVLFDGDAAGLRASVRGIDLILEEGMNVKVCTFPDGDDPDSFARKNPKDFVKNFIKNKAKDFIDFKAEILLKEANNDSIKKSEAIKDIIKSIGFVSNALKQEIYLKEVSSKFKLSENSLTSELNNQKDFIEKESKSQKKEVFKFEKNVFVETSDNLLILENRLIELMIKYGDNLIMTKYKNVDSFETTVIEEIINHLNEDEYEIISPINQIIIDEIKTGLEKNEIRTKNYFLNFHNEEVRKTVKSIIDDENSLSNWSHKNVFFLKENELINSIVYSTISEHKIEKIKFMIPSYIEKKNYKAVNKLIKLKSKINLKL